MAAPLMAAGHRTAVFLLTNDRGLCARAQANGIRCFTAVEFPMDPEALAKVSSTLCSKGIVRFYGKYAPLPC